jgi:hypothetical protein
MKRATECDLKVRLTKNGNSLLEDAVSKTPSPMGRRSFLKATASASAGLCIAGFIPELLRKLRLRTVIRSHQTLSSVSLPMTRSP